MGDWPQTLARSPTYGVGAAGQSSLGALAARAACDDTN
jgi:hypothetical protein